MIFDQIFPKRVFPVKNRTCTCSCVHSRYWCEVDKDSVLMSLLLLVAKTINATLGKHVQLIFNWIVKTETNVRHFNDFDRIAICDLFIFNPLSANPAIWSNALIVGLERKGLIDVLYFWLSNNIYILVGQITGPNDLWFKGPFYSKMFFNTADTHYDVECFEIGGMVQNITNWNKAVSNCASKTTFSKVFWWPCFFNFFCFC